MINPVNSAVPIPLVATPTPAILNTSELIPAKCTPSIPDVVVDNPLIEIKSAFEN